MTARRRRDGDGVTADGEAAGLPVRRVHPYFTLDDQTDQFFIDFIFASEGHNHAFVRLLRRPSNILNSAHCQFRMGRVSAPASLRSQPSHSFMSSTTCRLQSCEMPRIYGSVSV